MKKITDGLRGWTAFFVFCLILLVIIFVAVNLIVLLIPAALLLAFLFWLLGIIGRKRKKPSLHVWFRKF